MLIESTYDEFKYILYKPNSEENYPLIVVLHGSGEIGNNLSKLKKREPYLSLANGKCTPKAVILIPQLPKKTWNKYQTKLKDLIDHVAEE